MKSALSLPPATPSMRSILRFVPVVSLLCLLLSRTALHQTRFEDSSLGFGIGLLLGYVILSAFPRFLPSKEPEDSDLQILDLNS